MTEAVDDRNLVLVVEDDERVRRGIEALLAGAGYRTRGAPTGEAALLALDEPPNLALLDLGLPDWDGIELVAAFAARAPAVPVIVLTVVTDEASILAALRAGAVGYLFKEDVGRLVPSLKDALTGGAAMSPAVARLVLGRLRKEVPPPLAPPLLSGREREVLELLARGLSYEQAGLVLDLALNTIRTHVRNIYRKLDAATRLEAVLVAVRRGELSVSLVVGSDNAKS